MNPEDYFQPGSVPFIQAQEAINVINAAKAAGLPEAEQYEKSFISSLDIVRKNKDWSGFDATRQAIASLVPQVQAAAKGKNEVIGLAGQIEATKNLLGTYGVDLPKEQVQAISAAEKNNDIAGLKAQNDMLEARKAALIKSQLPMTPSEQAKMEVDKQALEAAKQKTAKEQEDAANAKYSLEETLKDKYKEIIEVKKDPDIKSAFGIPVSRLMPGTDASSLSAKVNRIANKEWIDAIIKSKAAGATFGSLTEKEGTKLATAATLLADPYKLNYETANDELLRMAESVKKLYRKATGREITEDVKSSSPTPPDEMTPQQEADAKAAKFRSILEGAP